MGDAALSILKGLGFLIAWAIAIFVFSIFGSVAVYIAIAIPVETWRRLCRPVLWWFLARLALPLAPTRIADAFMKREWIRGNVPLAKRVIRWMARAPSGLRAIAFIVSKQEGRFGARSIAMLAIEEDKRLESAFTLVRMATIPREEE